MTISDLPPNDGSFTHAGLMDEIRNDQILADTSMNRYILSRARCDVCKTKTWHFYWIKYYEWDIIGMREPLRHNEGISNCIEHSWADDVDRVNAAREEFSKSWGFEVKVDSDIAKRFMDFGKRMIGPPS